MLEWIFETNADPGNDYRYGGSWVRCGSGWATTTNLLSHLEYRWAIDLIELTPQEFVVILYPRPEIPGSPPANVRRRFRRLR